MITTHCLLLRIAVLVVVASSTACRDADAQRPPSLDARSPPVSSAIQSSSGFITANPLVSRGKRAFGWSPLRFAAPDHVNDGDPRTSWGAGKPTPERPAWVALDLGKGPARVLLNWSAGGSFDYQETDYGSPGSYRVETSSDSTDGVDGAWKAVVSVPAVTTHGEAHSFNFAGQRWVKLVVTSAPPSSPNGVQIDEVEVHDVSNGARDTWFFMGDSITAFAFGRPPEGGVGFAADVQRRHPRYFPAVINGGVGGDKSDDGLLHIDPWLAQNPDARFWCLGYGTNDAAGDAADTSRFRANLEAILDRVLRAGRVPILATIPFSSDGHHRNVPRFNDVIVDLQHARALPLGPDLYAWFSAHPDELRDGIHPNDRGIGSINRLWAEAVDTLYPK
jgi:acyl-CoA thioesterase I